MEAILNNLRDPSWWFSAFFIAIIASVIAGFLKDRIEKWLSTIFSGLKAWRTRREDARAKLIEAILADQMYLQIFLFQTVIALILFAVCSTIYYSAPALLTAVPAQATHLLTLDRKFFIWDILSPALGLFNVLVSYRTARRLSIASQAIREYRKRNSLPKLP